MYKIFENYDDILCLDIGSGTQDVLLASKDLNPENWTRFVLPTPARQIAKKIRNHTLAKQNIYLSGHNMGGGFFHALKEHLQAGLKMSMSISAAHSLYDDIQKVEALGVTIEASKPKDYVEIILEDFNYEAWQHVLSKFDLPLPDFIAISAQDHGVHKNISNREGRFLLWKEFLKASNNPLNWVTGAPREEFTRLNTIRYSLVQNGVVMDTALAALFGVLSLEEVKQKSYAKGVTIINVGNSHIVAFLVYQEKVFGIYEHHSGLLDLDAQLHELNEFRRGWLTDIQVRNSGGHGAVYYNDENTLKNRADASVLPNEAEGFVPTYIIGPKREILNGHGKFLAPYGDMMLSGCYGMLYALSEKCA